MSKLLAGLAGMALLFAVAAPGPVSAAPAKSAGLNADRQEATEFSSHRRHWRHRHHVRRYHYGPRYGHYRPYYRPYYYPSYSYYRPYPYYAAAPFPFFSIGFGGGWGGHRNWGHRHWGHRHW